MPKTRSSGNTIATRTQSRNQDVMETSGGIGIDGSQEMSERISERMQQVREIDVEVFSRTRGTMERLNIRFDQETPGTAQVVSGSGNTYIVNTEEATCTCPDHRYRGSRCRHIEGVAIAQEQIAQGTTIGSAEASEININEVIREHINIETSDEALNAERTFIDDNHFYTDNPEEFERDMARLSSEEVPYEYENALNGSNIKFGIELEFVNGNSNAIARELYDLGICGYPEMVSYHSRSIEEKWKLERDGSVTTGSRGGELVSPVLKDTPETWRQIETICQVIKRHGGRVNFNTGGHVHVSSDPLDGKRQRWRRLFKAFRGTEEAIFRFSGGELGRFRNTGYTASSINEMDRAVRTRLPESGDMNDFRNALSSSSINWQKYRSINLVPFTRGVRNAIEVRAFNGSLTPGIIQANVKVAAGLIHTAERSRVQGVGEGLTTESCSRRGQLINDYHHNYRDNATIIKMLDTFFSRKSDKEHILSIISKNEWR